MRSVIKTIAYINGALIIYGIACFLEISGRAEANYHPERRPSVGPGTY